MTLRLNWDIKDYFKVMKYAFLKATLIQILIGSTNYIPTLPTGSGNLPTTGQLLATDKRFSTLVLALETAFGNETGLAAPFTVFAPTNKAFAKIDENTLNGLLEKPEDLQNGKIVTQSSKYSDDSFRSFVSSHCRWKSCQNTSRRLYSRGC